MRTVTGAEPEFKRIASPRLSRTRPRAFPEWQALRRWGKLPPWEEGVAGYLLRALRAEASLTQRELAARLGVSQQAVAQAERWSGNPTVSFMRGWADACGAALELSFAPRQPGTRHNRGARR
ncbi:MAG: helix-turn-helix transcriptional regulator [Thermoanaerobaculaceae bacterium]|nr:helix-turn-helix transcriptional regulator [Thermoanaerobaculaceae bacterium]